MHHLVLQKRVTFVRGNELGTTMPVHHEVYNLAADFELFVFIDMAGSNFGLSGTVLMLLRKLYM